jgi:hypothetical protein
LNSVIPWQRTKVVRDLKSAQLEINQLHMKLVTATRKRKHADPRISILKGMPEERNENSENQKIQFAPIVNSIQVKAMTFLCSERGVLSREFQRIADQQSILNGNMKMETIPGISIVKLIQMILPKIYYNKNSILNRES